MEVSLPTIADVTDGDVDMMDGLSFKINGVEAYA
jgi:hypothetical protein